MGPVCESEDSFFIKNTNSNETDPRFSAIPNPELDEIVIDIHICMYVCPERKIVP